MRLRWRRRTGENRTDGMKPLCALLALASLASPVAAQEAKGALAGLAAYEGADRHQRLASKARARGLPQPVYVVSPRRRRNAQRGVRKEVRRESPRMARGLRESPAAHRGEAQAGRDEVDLVDSNSVPLELLRRQGLLQAVRSAYHADLIPAAVPEHARGPGPG